MFLDLWKECMIGKSLYRSMHNVSLRGLCLDGRTIDLGAKNGKSSYYRYIKVQDITYVDYFEGGENVIKLDLERELPIENDSYDNVVLFNTLEHISNYQLVITESQRILRPSGKLYGVVPFLYPFHADPHDFFRFTHEGLEKVLSSASFDKIEITQIGIGSFTCAANLCSWAFKFKPLVFLIWFLAIQLDKMLNRVTSRNKSYYIALAFVATKF
ncbi:methyltransferase domain-containing protein [Gammaproteobacteria bacterium LSUCC0112]|nr:methyltransferase domain-containing protein [Gammaproteobacteria bacterium LSUCC0112]